MRGKTALYGYLYGLAGAQAPENPMLTVTNTGVAGGGGSVTSTPEGIDCGADCSEAYLSGTSVELTGSADGASTFTEGTSGQSPGVEFTALADTWTEITITLGELGDPASISRLNFFNATAAAIGVVTFDQIRLEGEQVSRLFSDGFETGNTSAWSVTGP